MLSRQHMVFTDFLKLVRPSLDVLSSVGREFRCFGLATDKRTITSKREGWRLGSCPTVWRSDLVLPKWRSSLRSLQEQHLQGMPDRPWRVHELARRAGSSLQRPFNWLLMSVFSTTKHRRNLLDIKECERRELWNSFGKMLSDIGQYKHFQRLSPFVRPMRRKRFPSPVCYTIMECAFFLNISGCRHNAAGKSRQLWRLQCKSICNAVVTPGGKE